ncbi:MAG: hypothetical protein ACTSRZ_01070 [Promethearchaeota archaeon]
MVEKFFDLKKDFELYFNLLKEEFNEEVGLICCNYKKKQLEFDLLVGEESEKVVGLRIINMKSGEIDTLTRVSEDQLKGNGVKIIQILENRSKNKKSKIKIQKKQYPNIKSIKKIAEFSYISENLPISHKFEIFGVKIKKEDKKNFEIIKYAQMSRIKPSLLDSKNKNNNNDKNNNNNSNNTLDESNIYFKYNKKLSQLNI